MRAGPQRERPVSEGAARPDVAFPDGGAGLVDDKLMLNRGSSRPVDGDRALVNIGVVRVQGEGDARSPIIERSMSLHQMPGRRIEIPQLFLNRHVDLESNVHRTRRRNLIIEKDHRQRLGGVRQVESAVLAPAWPEPIPFPDLSAALVDHELVLHLAAGVSWHVDGAVVNIRIGSAREQLQTRAPTIKGTVHFDALASVRVESAQRSLDAHVHLESHWNRAGYEG